MKTLLAMTVAALAFAAHAADDSGKRAVSVTIAPDKVHEECMRLEAGEQRQFKWNSNVPVDFNIHYHEGPKVSYPVKREGIRAHSGIFTAKVGQDYCWMWTGRKAPATITGGIELAK